ncbi:hypothetical protein SAMN05444157_3344 [Frankineae bacterium MT45]|nr:hypothetical protein SAMN05444157_3344 [Frankineae bacterium MT45]
MSTKSSSGSFDQIAVLVEGSIIGDGVAFGHLGDTIGDAIAQAQIDAQTATAAGADVQVELGCLVDMYNHLSDLHTSLAQRHETLLNQVKSLATHAAGGSAPGIKAAWLAIAKSSGAASQGSATLIGNLKAVDQLVVGYMHAAHDNATAYAAQENLAVAQFGQAADSRGRVSGAANATAAK